MIVLLSMVSLVVGAGVACTADYAPNHVVDSGELGRRATDGGTGDAGRRSGRGADHALSAPTQPRRAEDFASAS